MNKDESYFVIFSYTVSTFDTIAMFLVGFRGKFFVKRKWKTNPNSTSERSQTFMHFSWRHLGNAGNANKAFGEESGAVVKHLVYNTFLNICKGYR